jgi:uncharacterized protein (UPF0210 family)
MLICHEPTYAAALVMRCNAWCYSEVVLCCCLLLLLLSVQGLAAAAAAGSSSISRLLQYSAVCGCGLDTVPVAGPCGDAAADDATAASIAALLCDVNTLAYR